MKLWKAPTPVTASSSRTRQWAATTARWRHRPASVNGSRTTSALVQRQKFKESGGISPAIARPRTKLPPQNSAEAASSR